MNYQLGYTTANAVPNEDGAYVQFGKSAKGAAQVAVKFLIAEGEDKGKFINWWGSFNGDKASEITIRALRAMGFTGFELADAMTTDLSKTVTIRILEDDYNGKISIKVTYVGPLDGGSVVKNAMTFPEIKALSATLKSKLMAAPVTAAPSPSKPAFPGAYTPAETAPKGPVVKGTEDDTDVPW